MAFDIAGNKAGPRRDVNVTPLIDIVLVLLIIFMVLTPVTLKHLTPTIPRDAQQRETAALPVTVELSATGGVRVNGEVAEWKEVQAVVTRRLRSSGRQVVFFKISDDADYGSAVRLMDLCKGAGAQILGVATYGPT